MRGPSSAPALPGVVAAPGAGCRPHAVSATSSSASETLRDRKSTRLNSSHDQISYAVFCLKKKKHKRSRGTVNDPLYQSVPHAHTRCPDSKPCSYSHQRELDLRSENCPRAGTLSDSDIYP